MLNSENMSLFPVYARSALETKLAASSVGLDQQEKSVTTTFQGACNSLELENVESVAASKLLEQEMREVFVGTVGGLGVAGLSASLLTSVLSTTLEDLLALGLCSAGGLLAISNFPASRQRVIDKVKRTANALARQIDEAMQNDLLETANSLNNFVTLVGKPYQEVAEDRLSKLSDSRDELTAIEEKLKTLRIEIQNRHVSAVHY